MKDLKGVALPGGSVELLDSTGKSVSITSVDQAGTYCVKAATGSYSLKLHPPLAYSLGATEPDVNSLVIPATAPVDFVAQPALYSDDFQKYTTAQLVGGSGTATGNIPAGDFFAGPGRDISIPNAQKISIDPNGGPNGSRAVRYTWDAKPFVSGSLAAYCAQETTVAMFPRISSPPATKNLWVRVTSKESPAFEHGSKDCVGIVGLSYKFILVSLESGSTYGRYGSYLGYNVGTDTLATTIFTDLVDITNQTVKYGSTIGAVAGSTWGGGYHTWILEMLNIGTSSSTFNIYKDGQLVPGAAVGPMLPGKTVGPGWAVGVSLGANINNGPDHAQSRWFREFGVYTTRPSLRPME